MSRFIQLHILTSYPPSNLNRDDMGSPKSAIIGGTNRIRISSQSLKRAWRTSEIFSAKASKGIRTKELGKNIVYPKLIQEGIDEKLALKSAIKIAGAFGKNKSEKKKGDNRNLEIEQIAFISPEELFEVDKLITRIVETKEEPSDKDIRLLRKKTTAADLAMFGRMIADDPSYNIEASVQVAHAFTVHSVKAENDFFTAVDDLSEESDDAGASHLGEREFAAGLYYIYICINADLLRENLTLGEDTQNAEALAQRALQGLTEAAITVSPSGMQNSFASRARASYVLAEKGDELPRSLSVAFLRAIKNNDILDSAIAELERQKKNIDRAYEITQDAFILDTTGKSTLASEYKSGSLGELLSFVSGR